MGDNRRILYALLGCLTGCLGGAAFGYFYAKAAREANAMRGIPDNSIWHNSIFATVVGFITGSVGIGGLCYGYAYGTQEMQLAKLKSADREMQPYGRPSTTAGYAPTREREADYWRSRIAAEEPTRFQGR